MEDDSRVPITVELNDISKRYPGQPKDQPALKNITLKATMGQIVCLLGPNGSGKTTLLKILAGLLHPTSGTVHIMGDDHRKNSLKIRGQIGWMPSEERSGFYGRLTGNQNLQFFATLQKIPSSDYNRIIGNLSLQIGLKNELDKMILKNSGGARQKLSLARALIHNPSVLLLDEPMRNLDPHTLRRFRRLIKDHLTRKQNKTVILSTHQLEEARRVADVVIIMKNGEIIKSIASRDLERELRNTTLEDFYMKTVGPDEN